MLFIYLLVLATPYDLKVVFLRVILSEFYDKALEVARNNKLAHFGVLLSLEFSYFPLELHFLSFLLVTL